MTAPVVELMLIEPWVGCVVITTLVGTIVSFWSVSLARMLSTVGVFSLTLNVSFTATGGVITWLTSTVTVAMFEVRPS